MVNPDLSGLNLLQLFQEQVLQITDNINAFFLRQSPTGPNAFIMPANRNKLD
jgi:hypothetical protein